MIFYFNSVGFILTDAQWKERMRLGHLTHRWERLHADSVDNAIEIVEAIFRARRGSDRLLDFNEALMQRIDNAGADPEMQAPTAHDGYHRWTPEQIKDATAETARILSIHKRQSPWARIRRRVIDLFRKH